MSIFHERLKQLKDDCGETQVRIAEALGITPQALSYYMNGREPNFDVLVKIADYFDVTTDYLLGRSRFQSQDEQKYINHIVNNIDSQKEKLNVRELRYFTGIERNILEAFFYLTDEDADFAVELLDIMYATSEMLCFLCETAFAVFNAGYDSFDMSEIPQISKEISERARADTVESCENIAYLIKKIADRMIRALPEHEQPKSHYLSGIKQVLRNKIESENVPLNGKTSQEQVSD